MATWKAALGVVAGLLGGLAVVLTLLPWSRSTRWWIRIWDFPRLQIAGLGVAAIAAAIVAGPPRSVWPTSGVVLVGLAVIYQVTRIVRYTALVPVQAVASAGPPAAEDTITLLVTNVRMENRDAARLLGLIDAKDPDIVLVLEPDRWWITQLEPVRRTHPTAVCEPHANTYGMALYSRLALSDVCIRELTREHVPSIRTTVTLSKGDDVVLYALHPPPPVPEFSEASRPRDAELIVVAREAANRSRPTIVAGDLNDVAWSDTTTRFQRISGLLDPRVGRGMFNTFHARYWFARWPLDHVYVSRDFTVIALERLPDIGSDHFPLLISLALEKRPDRHDPPEPAGEGTAAWADEILEGEPSLRDADDAR